MFLSTRSQCRCHKMETFSALLAICAGNSPVTGEFPAQRPVTRSFDVFVDLLLNKRLSKQWSGWWCKPPSRPLWRHCNECHSVMVLPCSTGLHLCRERWQNNFKAYVIIMRHLARQCGQCRRHFPWMLSFYSNHCISLRCVAFSWTLSVPVYK